MLKLSKAPIPADTIGLAEAFNRVCERLPGWREIISEMEAGSAELEAKNIRYSECSSANALDALDAATDSDLSPEQNEVARAGERLKLLVLRQHWRKVEADRIMRESLANGALVAKVENPRTGEPRQLNNIGRWLPPRDLPRVSAPCYLKFPPATTQHDIEYEPGFRSDYVEEWDIKRPMPDQPGPPTNFDDQTLHRVFFDETEFNAWFTPAPKNRGGRPQEFNWESSRIHCLELIAKYGKPGRSNKKLPTQKDLIDLIVGYLAEQDIHPAGSTIARKVREWLLET
jgi:hypothetical protein